MTTRSWPYGTRKTVRIKDIVRARTIAAVVCADEAEPSSAYALLDRLDRLNVRTGDRRTIVFTRGGPTGGHWAFEPLNPGGAS